MQSKLIVLLLIIIFLHSCNSTKIAKSCDYPTDFNNQFPNGFYGIGLYTYDPSQEYLNRSNRFAQTLNLQIDTLTYTYSYLKFRIVDRTISDSIIYFITFSNPLECKYHRYYKQNANDSDYNYITTNLNFIAKKSINTKCGLVDVYKYTHIINNQCFTVYVAKELGVFKCYGPNIYDNYQLDFQIDTKEQVLMNEILVDLRSDQNFLTNCNGDVAW